MIDFYIVKNERKLSKDQKRYSLTQNTHSKCKSQSNPRDSRRIGTACTVYSSNNHSLTQR